ncbi:hypothetical protein ScPMuIL_010147 [Solemya velum]
MLNFLMAITVSRPEPEEYNPERALDLWWHGNEKSRRPDFKHQVKMKFLWQILLCTFICLSVTYHATCQDFDEDDYGDEMMDDETIMNEENDDIETEEPPPPKEKVVFRPVKPKGPVAFVEPFNKEADFYVRWTASKAKKDGAEEDISKYDGKWEVEEPADSALRGDLSLVLKTKAKHHAVSAKLDKVYEFVGKPFIVQYEVRFASGIDCGGAYIKLLSYDTKFNPETFQDKTPYTIMFGPDKCGLDHKLHFIFRHRNPKTGEFEEKHAKKPSANIDSNFSDKKTHLYTLIVNPDNTFEILIDNAIVNKGSLLSDVTPDVNPPKEIADPNDSKPEDWDEREKIADPDATKPDDWDEDAPLKIEDPNAVMPDGWLEEENEHVADPDAQKPEDWDDEMDGQWEAPLIDNEKCKEAPGCGPWKAPVIDNPDFKGKWKAPMIDNPNYKGVWKAQIIPNPDYFEDLEPYKMTPIGALGLELWSMNDNIIFDNFIITDDRSVAESWAADTWEIKSAEERSASTSGRSVVEAVQEATKERPWLWAVFIVVVVLPIVLIIAYCCMSKSKPETIEAHRKKTDEPTPDTVDEKNDKDESKEDKKDEENKENEKVKESKHNVENNVNASGDNQKTKKTRADLEAEEDEEDEGEDEEAPSQGSPRQSPRRRKARKD